MFDDPAHGAWVIANPDPTLGTFVQRLRPLVKSSPYGMFSALVFRRFVDHPALIDGSRLIALMNKAHHGRRQEIRAADVGQCADDLSVLLDLVEQMYEECYRWRRRDVLKDQSAVEAPPALAPMPHPALNVMVCPDLAALHRTPLRVNHKKIRNASTLTFSTARSPIISADPILDLPLAVGRLACDCRSHARTCGRSAACHCTPWKHHIRAPCRARGANPGIIGLTAKSPIPGQEPRRRSSSPRPTLPLSCPDDFHHSLTVAPGQDEAAPVDVSDVLKRIEIAFRVYDSAVPLALEKQVVLGAGRIELDELGQYKDALVALTLDDGSSIFKRVGAALPSELAHLRQFESIGGLGSSQVLSVGKPHKGFRSVTSARAIVGVLYHG